MRFLITGSCGFIGFHLCKNLLEEKSNVLGIDNLNSYYDVYLKETRLNLLKKYNSFKFLKIDLTDKESLNKFQEAILSYKKAIDLKASNVQAYYNLASLFYLLENYIQASNYFKNIINLKARQEEICERYAICLFKINKKTEVKDFILKIISKFPKNRVLNNLLGQSLLALNSHKEGLSYIKNGAGFLEIDENGVRLL